MKNLGNDCSKLISRLFNKELTKDQYINELMILHQKYIMPGKLTTYQMKNWRKHKEICVHEENNKLKYEDFLQPTNFNEACQMFFYFCNPEKESEERIRKDFE